MSDGSCNIVAIERKQLVNHVFTDERFLEHEKEIHYIRNIHSKSTRDTFSLPTPTAKAAPSTFPKPGLTRDSVCKQITATITHGKAGQGKTIRDKPPPQQLPQGKPKPLPKPRADRWASAATGLTLQTLSEPFPSINQSVHKLIHHIRVLTRLTNMINNSHK